MRLVAALALIALPATTLAQSNPAGIGIERVTLHPGETKAFTLAPGNQHQLLVMTDPAHPAAHAITVRYEAGGGRSRLIVTSRTGYPLGFTVLADPNGDGGFKPAGDIANLSGDGTPVTRDWPRALGTINVGDFVGGPHGDHPHEASGG